MKKHNKPNSYCKVCEGRGRILTHMNTAINCKCIKRKIINLPNRLKLIRINKGYTIKQVSNTINITQYDKWETGRISPRFKDLKIFCDFMEIPIYELFAKNLKITVNDINN